MSVPTARKTLLSRRVVRDMEHERYHPELEDEIKECLYCLRRNAMMFNLEVDPDLVEQRIYERQAAHHFDRAARFPRGGAAGDLTAARNRVIILARYVCRARCVRRSP